jgi:ribonuclease VapC
VASAVLDSSVVLAIINGEPGSEKVAGLISDCLLSAVNYAEVITKLVERSGSLERARKALAILDLNVVDFDRELADNAGGFVTRTRARGLSLGDRSCLALALRERVPAITADRAWQSIDLEIEVRLFR